jgi:hypothetical protein
MTSILDSNFLLTDWDSSCLRMKKRKQCGSVEKVRAAENATSRDQKRSFLEEKTAVAE